MRDTSSQPALPPEPVQTSNGVTMRLTKEASTLLFGLLVFMRNEVVLFSCGKQRYDGEGPDVQMTP